MATRSTIALELEDGTVQAIYCHWDGYLSNNGQILHEHYTDPAKVRRLMDLGDLGNLGAEIGEKHDFDAKTPDCTFYGRDRGEDDCHARDYKSFTDYLMNLPAEDYNYILRRNGKWYVSSIVFDTDGFLLLEEAMAKFE